MVEWGFDPKRARRLLVLFVDLGRTPEGGYASHEITISAVKEFGQALQEAHEFVQHAYMLPGAEGPSGMKLLADLDDGRLVALPVPPPNPPQDHRMRCFVVAWASPDSLPSALGPLAFIDVDEDRPTAEDARLAALAFIQILHEEGRRVLYLEGHDGRAWHRLDATGRLPRQKLLGMPS